MTSIYVTYAAKFAIAAIRNHILFYIAYPCPDYEQVMKKVAGMTSVPQVPSPLARLARV